MHIGNMLTAGLLLLVTTAMAQQPGPVPGQAGSQVITQPGLPSPSFEFNADSVAAGYRSALGQASLLYNGPEYFHDDRLLNDHVFLQTANFQDGAVRFEGNWYTGVPLQYDILRDEVVTLSYGKNFRVLLLREKLDAFILRSQKFIQINPPAGSRIAGGFYQVIYEGATQVLAKRGKKLSDDATGGTVKYNVNATTTYWVFANGSYHTVSDKDGLVKLLAGQSEERASRLNSFASTNSLDFRAEPDKLLHDLSAYFDQINRP